MGGMPKLRLGRVDQVDELAVFSCAMWTGTHLNLVQEVMEMPEGSLSQRPRPRISSGGTGDAGAGFVHGAAGFRKFVVEYASEDWNRVGAAFVAPGGMSGFAPPSRIIRVQNSDLWREFSAIMGETGEVENMWFACKPD